MIATIIDILDHLPLNHTNRSTLIGMYQEHALAIINHQDAVSDLWYTIVDEGAGDDNYLEMSGSAFFTSIRLANISASLRLIIRNLNNPL